VHRDIKPENIAISPDFERAVLLDLGVLRPVGAGGPPITDEAHRFFLGTLQYSSPELLMRREVDNRDGWRAVTFYQLGAVLHDFIMRRRIFADFEDPYPALADAIHNTKPVISANDVPGDLVVLAQNCLMKKPAMRLEYVTWESFEPGVESPSEDATIERIRRRTAADQEGNTLGSAHREQSAARTLQTVVRDIQDLIRQQCMSTGVFPPMRMQAEFDGTTTKAAVFVLFSKSRAAAMKQNLIVGFNIGLDDASDMAIRVTASACLSKSDAGFGKVLVSCEDEPLFGGAFDASTFAKAVKGMMLDLLERAQTQAPATGVSVLRGKMRPS
jgi:serine/threonine protein kinase